jgi:hypothetical protein
VAQRVPVEYLEGLARRITHPVAQLIAVVIDRIY